MKKNWLRKIPVVIAIAVIGIGAFSGLFMLLWNSIIPSVFHIGMITFWQAAGILLLSKILFGGFRGRHRFAGGCGRKAMWMKWHNMTPEDKEKFRSMNHPYAMCWNENKSAAATE